MNSSGGNPNEKLTAIADIFHLMEADSQENIHIILKQACNIFGGICALYNRIIDKEKSIEIWSITQTPENRTIGNKAIELDEKAIICRKETIKTQGNPVDLPDLSKTSYLKTNSFVKNHNLKAYLGCHVSLQKKAIGSLCIFDTKKRDFTLDEINSIKILAKAISLEEEKLALESKLKNTQKLELFRTITGRAAHNLNNILSGLISYPELLAMQLPEDSPLKGPISFIHESGTKAADIVQDLLYLTRTNPGGESIINLNNTIFEYFNSPDHKRLEKKHPFIEFKVKTAPELTDIKGTPIHIIKILITFLMNAAKAAQPYSRIWIETFNQQVTSPIYSEDTIPEGNYACLKISDDNAAMAQEDLKNIFEPFYEHKKTKATGSGFGLFLAHNLVKDHNGHIQVKSSENKGNAFEIYFPAIR